MRSAHLPRSCSRRCARPPHPGPTAGGNGSAEPPRGPSVSGCCWCSPRPSVCSDIAVGTRPIGLGTVWQALTVPSLTGDEAIIVCELRVPRTLLGLLAGLALGVPGALMQGHTRNPLGDPGLLGVTAGASFAVVLSISLLGFGTPAGYIWFALAGALAGSVAVFAIGSSGPCGATPVSLALAGAALSALLYALIQAITIRETTTLDAFRFWVVGALAGRGPDVVAQVAPFIVAGLVLAVLNAPALNPAGAR